MSQTAVVQQKAGAKPKGRGYVSKDDERTAREARAYKFWRMRFLEGKSFWEIGQAEGVATSTAAELCAVGAGIMGKFRAAVNQEKDFAIAEARLEFIWARALPKAEIGSPKHLAILCKVSDMHHEICGLKKFEIRQVNSAQPAEVLERVRAVQVVSPLVAEVLPQLPEAA